MEAAAAAAVFMGGVFSWRNGCDSASGCVHFIGRYDLVCVAAVFHFLRAPKTKVLFFSHVTDMHLEGG